LRNDSLRTIAQRAGVSAKTVSRILGGKAHLHKDETVERVMEMAREVGYRPNLLAKGILEGRTQTVGLMIPSGQSVYTTQLFLGIHDALIEADCAPIMLVPRSRVARPLEQIHRLLDRRVDGIILGQELDWIRDEHLEDVWKRQIPLVTVQAPLSGTRHADFAGTDEEAGADLVARHLASLGHRQVAYITWSTPGGALSLRREAFRRAFTDAGLDARIVEVERVPSPYAKEFLVYLLGDRNRATAVALAGDELIFGAFQAARALGLSVPDDLSICGYAHHDFEPHLDPPVTTVREFPYEIGTEAVALLFRRIGGETLHKDGQPRMIRVRPELDIRTSTGPVPQSVEAQRGRRKKRVG